MSQRVRIANLYSLARLILSNFSSNPMASKTNSLRRSETPKPRRKKSAPRSSSKKTSVPFYRQARFRKVLGLFFMLVTAFLFVSFVSYCFTWKTDNDLIWGKDFSVVFDSQTKVSNSLGRLGAITAYSFFHRWIGVSSFVLPLLFLLTGLRLFYGLRKFGLRKSFLMSGLLILWLSTTLAPLSP